MSNTIREFLQKKIQKSIKKIFKYDIKNIEKDYDSELILKYRIAIRRLRSLLEEFINEIKIDLDIIDDLRSVFRKAGKIRDYDILIENLEKYHNEIKELKVDIDLEPLIAELKQEFEKRRKKQIKNFEEFLESKKYKNIVEELEILKENIEFKNFYISDSDSFSVAYLVASKFFRLISHSYWKVNIYDIKALHHLRRQIKRTRYYMEILKKFYKKNNEYKNILERLKNLQDLAGALVDIYILKDELEKFQKKYLPDIYEENDMQLKLQKFGFWLQEKEDQIFQQWNQEKEDFFLHKDFYLSVILENCDIQNIKAKEIED